MSYPYRPLDEATQEIRLLNILPGAAFEAIRCNLVHSQCQQRAGNYRYVALSYCWGDPSNSKSIFVDGYCVSVAENLWAALHEFRRRGFDVIWVDALCINQGDNDEKGRQILRMGDIYKYSQKTISWLGPDERGQAESACNCMTKISSQRENDHKAHFKTLRLSRKRRQHNWRASIAPFLASPYWRRTWIIQELSLSNAVWFWWGKHSITLEVLSACIKRLFEEYSAFRDLSGLPEIKCILRIRELTEEVRVSGAKSSKLSLHKALCLSSLSVTSEPLDKIFAVLGLCHDGPDLVPHPNYNQTLDNLLRDLTIATLIHYRNRKGRMDSICVGNPKLERRPELQSWVIDWASTWQSQGANQLVYGQYKACGSSFSKPKLSPDRLTLSIPGYVFDTIQSLSETYCGGSHNHRTSFLNAQQEPEQTEFTIQHNVYGTEAELYNAIWYSILDQSPEKPSSASIESVPAYFSFQRLWSKPGQSILAKRSAKIQSRVCATGRYLIYGRPLAQWAQYQDPSKSPPRKLKLPRKDIVYHGAPATVDDVLASFINSLALFRLYRRIVVTSMGYVGRAHMHSCVGDLVCLLEGGTVPVILRPFEGGYRLVGEAYIHGIMKGEFWNDQHQAEMQVFDLK
ncbi:HET-domain-containing protein [Acephala macrosclerotiorum]|nr:HET-domain-containing protein [Acephala macrosclerotiorum]